MTRLSTLDRGPHVLAGRFELGDAIGQGGSATVRRARDRSTGAVVAVKLIEPGAVSRERFLREAHTLAALTAPGIVRYVAHGSEGGQLYLVEEWLAGSSLRTHLASSGVTAAEAVCVVRAAADGLAVAHAAGVVHRDIKPEHLWLGGTEPAPTPRDPLGRVTLIDFGIARGTRDPRVTASGVAIGTPGYMAPEQARGERAVDARADVFALGAVLFEALTGTPAFVGHCDAATRAKVVLAAPPALCCPEAPRALVALVEAMLAKSPAARPDDAGAVAAALATIAIPDGSRRRATSGDIATPRTERAVAPTAYVVAAGYAGADRDRLAALAGAPVELIDGALWLAVLPGRVGAARARTVAEAWHALLGAPTAVAAADPALDVAVDWAASSVARAALLAEFAAFHVPPAAVQLDATTTLWLARGPE